MADFSIPLVLEVYAGEALIFVGYLKKVEDRVAYTEGATVNAR